MKLFNYLVILSSLLLSSMAFANTLSIDNGYVRATPPHAQNSAAFMVINNDSDTTINLIAASSEIAARVELHSHIMEDGLMKMRQVEKIEVLAGKQATLQPGGYHVMFMGLKQDLEVGKLVKLTLHFDNDTTLDLELPIKKIKMMKH